MKRDNTLITSKSSESNGIKPPGKSQKRIPQATGRGKKYTSGIRGIEYAPSFLLIQRQMKTMIDIGLPLRV